MIERLARDILREKFVGDGGNVDANDTNVSLEELHSQVHRARSVETKRVTFVEDSKLPRATLHVSSQSDLGRLLVQRTCQMFLRVGEAPGVKEQVVQDSIASDQVERFRQLLSKAVNEIQRCWLRPKRCF